MNVAELGALFYIYGPVMENNIWRIRYNEEMNTLLEGEDG
jgi:hypothetical protein